MVLPNPSGLEGSLLLIEDSVLLQVGSFRQSELQATEAGGILLGYRRGPHLHVMIATAPGPGDKRSRYHFSRDDRSHALIARTEWERSGETMDYIGEWHTHPESNPKPSSLDFCEWLMICKRRTDPMVFLIQGIRGIWVGVGVGRLMQGQVARERLDPQAFAAPVDSGG